MALGSRLSSVEGGTEEGTCKKNFKRIKKPFGSLR
jgi:hypothetical protein